MRSAIPGILLDLPDALRRMSHSIPVVDLFAGPGGLGEGFASFAEPSTGDHPFRISISIENDPAAHRTLKLRAFFRQFPIGAAPEPYYDFLKGRLGESPEEVLYQLPEVEEQVEAAEREARSFTLGKSHSAVYKAIREKVGRSECLLLGGPPCQAYSIVGRSRNYGDKSKNYQATEDHRNFLYIEYLRIVARFQPLAFVMENVKGMLSAKVGAKPIFETIKKDLQDPCKAVSTAPEGSRKKHRYKLYSFATTERDSPRSEGGLLPAEFVIASERYGVPQARHRVILLGIREDVASEAAPEVLEAHDDTVSAESVIRDLPKLRSRLSKELDGAKEWLNAVHDFPLSSLQNELPGDLVDSIVGNLDQVKAPRDDFGSMFGLKKSINATLPDSLANWYTDERLSGYVTNHEARGHLRSDLHRYFYSAVYAKCRHQSPKAKDFPRELWPNHKNFSSGRFADRFRVQNSGKPGSTITSHISKDGHYYIHHDPTQCRSYTVREAARIQTFPDNYMFVGNRTQQYVQVGNAVPPFLAQQLASTIYKALQA